MIMSLSKSFHSAVFFALLLCLASCTKESNSIIDTNPNPEISDIPAIELLQVNPTTVIQYQDSIVFRIKYIDGDGDLGTNDPDQISVELVDNRDPDLLIFGYHLSPRTPDGAELTIQGELSIVLNNSILLDSNNDTEQTTFSIRVVDRAGNWSNSVESEAIIINK